MANSSSAYKFPQYEAYDRKIHTKPRPKLEVIGREARKKASFDEELLAAKARRERKQPTAAAVAAELPKVKKKIKTPAFRFALAVIFIFSIAFIILLRYAMITEVTENNLLLKKQYEEIAEDNKRINVEIDSNVNLSKVEEIAINRLGMKKPEKYQMVYIDVVGDDFVKTADLPVAAGTVRSEFYAAIIKTLGNVLEYLY